MNVDLKMAAGERAGYRPDIDGLRALAVASVVIYHAFSTSLLGGFVGVDIFFVISGYLISGHIWNDVARNRFDLLQFYGRRIRRIYPALLLVLLCTLGFGAVVLFSNELAVLMRDAAASSVFISNIVFWRSAGYFEPAAESQPLLHLWSLGIEEQFYIIWPVFLFFLSRCKRLVIPGVLLLIFISFALNLWLVGGHPNAAFYLPFTRFWELGLGGLLALCERLRVVESKNAIAGSRLCSHMTSVVGALGLLYSIFYIRADNGFPGVWALAPVMAAVLLIGAGPAAVVNRFLLSAKPLVMLGVISYPLYLWHWPLIVFSRIVGGEKALGVTAMAAVCIAAVILACLTYRFLELPLRRMAARLPGRGSQTRGLFVGLMSLGILSFCVSFFGFPFNRFGGSNPSLDTAREFASSPQCRVEHPGPADFCRMSAPASSRVLLLGDSHANHLIAGLEPLLEKTGTQLVALGSGNCQPFYGVETHLRTVSKRCPEIFDSALDYGFKAPDVGAVVLSSYAIAAVKGGLDYSVGDAIFLTDIGGAANAGSERVYLTGLDRTLKRSFAARKPVILVLDNPELNFDPVSCLKRPLSYGHDGGCTVPRTLVDTRQLTFKNAVREVAAKYGNVQVFDPAAYLCDDRLCRAKANGNVLYMDRNHLSVAGAQFLARPLTEVIFRAFKSGQ